MAEPVNAARLEQSTPKLLTSGAVLIVCAYGLLLMIPVLASLMVVSVLPMGPVTLLLPLFTMAVTVFFLPFGFGNTYIRRITRSMAPHPADSFLVQLTLRPRLRSGVRALLEDADDVGWLGLGDSALLFRGDGLALEIPFRQIESVQKASIGLRGLFVYPQLVLKVSGLDGVQSISIAERSSALLPSARRINQLLYERLAAKVEAAKPS
jgi:hypothetical protein